MKLCLDEHYCRDIAEELRGRGHDVYSVKERSDLIGLSDSELWTRMSAEKRALLTENVSDFMPLVQQGAAAGESHSGVIFSSSKSMPRSRATIGVFTERLDALLKEYPGEEDFRERVHWLEP